MAEYRVGGAFRPEVERQAQWIEDNRPDLQPTRVIRSGDPWVRLVITIDADSEAGAVAQAQEAFQDGARRAGVAGSETGPTGSDAWLVSEDPPAHYQP